MKVLLVFALLGLAVALPATISDPDPDAYYWYQFGKWVEKFNKDYYERPDYPKPLYTAFENFKNNQIRINEFNAKPNRTYTLAMNEFGDLTSEEFAFRHMGLQPAKKRSAPHVHQDSKAAAGSIDWRQKNVVNPVKDQASCGSCWAFSAIGSLESAYAIKTGKLVSLSEQQLVDCSTSYGNQGCNGGWMDQAFQYVIQGSQGEDTTAAYPYEAVDGSCRFKKASIAATMSSYVDIPANDEASLENAVATKGPVSVAINVVFDFQFYSGGVYDSSSCSSDASQLNHGVVVVGFSNDASPFWIVRNSWGASWGENGYIRMAKGKNLCGIADAASYPVV